MTITDSTSIPHLRDVRDAMGEHDQLLTGRHVLVTGADVGIGQAIASAVAAAGADVAIHYPPGGPGPDETLALVKSTGRTAVAVEGDLGDRTICHAVVDTAADGLGGLDGLVNNAGITRTAPFTEVDSELFSTLLSINLGGQFFCAQRAAHYFPRNEAPDQDSPDNDSGSGTGGSIVNISSIHASRGYPRSTVYAAAKGAIEAWTRTAAIELAPAIRINAVAPGLVETPRVVGEIANYSRERVGAYNPLGRVGLPSDIADVVVFLLSDASRYMTGQVLHVDGGTTAH